MYVGIVICSRYVAMYYIFNSIRKINTFLLYHTLTFNLMTYVATFPLRP